jgi:signal transduction histidine kinase
LLRDSAGSNPFGVERLQPLNLGHVPQLVESGMLDLSTVWKATQAISGEANFERLLQSLMAIVKESAGAQKGVLLLKEGGEDAPRFLVQAESTESGLVKLLQAEPLEDHAGVPVGLIQHVILEQTGVVLGNAAREGAFTRNPYVQARQLKSVLALPVVNQGYLLGVLYLENNLVSDAFTPERLSVLQILAGQAAVSIQKVRAAERAAYLEAEQTVKDTYANELEARVRLRTAELEQALDQLKELDRLKTNFLGVVSHELRTPLTTIRGFSELLEDGAGGDLQGRQVDYVKQIQDGAIQLQRLVDDLIDFAQVEAGAVKLMVVRVDLAAKIEEAIESLAPILSDGQLAIEVLKTAGPCWGMADPGRITQVVQNLVGNARKFTQPGGRITVTLAVVANELQVTIADTGVGIAAVHLPKLFQRFYQADSTSTRANGGLGLGLAISLSIVEAHGGAMGVESIESKGSEFWFTLPLLAESA